MASKLTSRKFWMAAAAALASIGGSIAGLATENEVLAAAGVFCTMASCAIYAAAEAYVDGKAAASTTVQTQISASTMGATTSRVVDTVLPEAKAEAAKAEQK